MRRRKPTSGASSLPPYHPDYQEGEHSYDSQRDDDSSDNEITPPPGHRVRRGSEGYEIRPQDRDQMLREYLESLGEQPDRYIRYIPEVEQDSETDEDEDDIALGNVVPNGLQTTVS